MSRRPGQDRLLLRGVVCRCHIGVTEEERRERQRIEADLELYAGLEDAALTGELGKTIDYREVCDAVRSLLEGRDFRLLEAAARQTLDVVLKRFPAERAVVRLRKFVLTGVAYVEVRMERCRDG